LLDAMIAEVDDRSSASGSLDVYSLQSLITTFERAGDEAAATRAREAAVRLATRHGLSDQIRMLQQTRSSP
jgi:hypothetical protein